MKDEMNSMTSNGVWNLVELPDGVKALDVNRSSRQRRIHWATLKDIKQDSLLKDSLRLKESTRRRPSFMYPRKVLFTLFWRRLLILI